MDKFESKYRATADYMDEALLLILKQKDFDYITVKELCKKAGVNRSTFYLHYDNMCDLLSETIEFLKEKLVKKFEKLDFSGIEKREKENLLFYTPKYCVPYLEFIKENKKAFKVVFARQGLFETDKTSEALYLKIFLPIMQQFDIDSHKRKYIIKFYLSGIHSIIVEWIKGDCQDDIEFVANLVAECVYPKRRIGIE